MINMNWYLLTYQGSCVIQAESEKKAEELFNSIEDLNESYHVKVMLIEKLESEDESNE